MHGKAQYHAGCRVIMYIMLHLPAKLISLAASCDSSGYCHGLNKAYQLWGSNPHPYGLAPEASALDHSAELSCFDFFRECIKHIFDVYVVLWEPSDLCFENLRPSTLNSGF